MKTLTHVIAGLSGALFAVGLVLGGMTQPAKVVAFLDFFGDWDPSLAFVMVGAILVYMPLYRLAMARGVPLGCERYSLSSLERIDARLIGGAALFGTGWGLAGYCPGPGLASLGTGTLNVLVFVGAMLGGMTLFAVYDRVSRARPRATAAQ